MRGFHKLLNTAVAYTHYLSTFLAHKLVYTLTNKTGTLIMHTYLRANFHFNKCKCTRHQPKSTHILLILSYIRFFWCIYFYQFVLFLLRGWFFKICPNMVFLMFFTSRFFLLTFFFSIIVDNFCLLQWLSSFWDLFVYFSDTYTTAATDISILICLRG